MIEVIELTCQSVCWPFDRPPFVYIPGQSYRRQEVIDPFPCYPHDVQLVRELADYVASFWTLSFDIQYIVLPFETQARTNGWFYFDTKSYGDDGKPKERVGTVVLPGKRIPLHPAMTRYLLGHETAHAIEDDIAIQRGLNTDNREILTEYAQVRELGESQSFYGGNTWHLSTGEVFADDWRILFPKLEMEFWPHPGIPRPGEVPAIVEWWENAKNEHELWMASRAEYAQPEAIAA